MKFERYKHYDPDLENAVIGVILMEKSAIAKTIGIIKPEYFYTPTGMILYGAMEEMFNGNIPIDLLTVTDYLVNEKKTPTVPNGDHVSYALSKSMNMVVSGAHLEWHCFILKQQWQRREILRLKFQPLVEDGVNPLADAETLKNQLYSLLGGTVQKEWTPIDEAVFDLIKHQNDMLNGGAKVVTTGLQTLDFKNRGFSAGDFVVIGARPGVGKSALMGRMALQIAHSGKSVGIISLEMSNVQIMARMAAIETNIPFEKVYYDLMKDESEHRRFYDIVSRSTVNLPIYFSDKTNVNITDIKAKAMKLKSSIGCDVLFVDYLQLIESKTNNRNYNREQEVSQMSRGLKLLAKDLEIPVIALAQLNREVTNRPRDKRYPVLKDLRESGSIEQDADVVMFLHRDYNEGWLTDENGNSTEFEADLIVRKWRNGGHPHIKLDFHPEQMKFSERKGSDAYVTHRPQQEAAPVNGSTWSRVANDENPF